MNSRTLAEEITEMHRQIGRPLDICEAVDHIHQSERLGRIRDNLKRERVERDLRYKLYASYAGCVSAMAIALAIAWFTR